MVNQYLETKPDPATDEFLSYDLAGLTDRFGGVLVFATDTDAGWAETRVVRRRLRARRVRAPRSVRRRDGG
jgi:hypothetical protein